MIRALLTASTLSACGLPSGATASQAAGVRTVEPVGEGERALAAKGRHPVNVAGGTAAWVAAGLPVE
jgi:hypothetical protein